jgi:hypothetical protein
MKGLSKVKKFLIQYIQYLCRNLNPGWAERKADFPILQQKHLYDSNLNPFPAIYEIISLAGPTGLNVFGIWEYLWRKSALISL